jgi:hypothetical protein
VAPPAAGHLFFTRVLLHAFAGERVDLVWLGGGGVDGLGLAGMERRPLHNLTRPRSLLKTL